MLSETETKKIVRCRACDAIRVRAPCLLSFDNEKKRVRESRYDADARTDGGRLVLCAGPSQCSLRGRRLRA